jgi:hypothetical protein
VARSIAAALARLAASGPGQAVTAWSGDLAPGVTPVTFTLDIPDDRVRGEWIYPDLRLRRKVLVRRLTGASIPG